MRYFWVCVLSLILFIVLGTFSVVGAQQQTFEVGVYNNAPKIYEDNYDKPAGVWVDILDYIAKKENWNLEYVFGGWEEGLIRLKNGEIDIMPDVALSAEREKIYDFTKETVLNSWGVVYVQKNSSISSVLDLQGKKISILKSSIYNSGPEGINAQLRKFGVKATIVEVESDRQTLDLLELGKVDAAIVGHVFGVANEKNYSGIKASKIFLQPTELRFALTKGGVNNSYLTGKLDYWVKKLKDGYEGYYNKILEKYGLEGLESSSNQTSFLRGLVIPTWGYILLGIIIGFLSMLSFPLIVSRIRPTPKRR